MQLEWDWRKAATNLVKHGVSFEEAVAAFQDPLSITIPEPLHSVEEERYILVGRTLQGRTVVVVHAERDERIRVISARLATTAERRSYEEGGGK